MASSETFIFRIALDGQKSIYRDIETAPSMSLYKFAQAITDAFGFDFDHAFGFYSGLNNCFARSSLSCVKTTDFTFPTGS